MHLDFPALLTTEEAAELLRMSPRTLARFRCEGKGPMFLKPGNGRRAKVLYDHRDLEKWVNKKFQSTSERC